MSFRLRVIPDSVDEFTGFCKGFDLLGGDFLGYGAVNHYRPRSGGSAQVRNVWLPTRYRHGDIPDTRHLLEDPRMVEWIDRYRPAPGPVVDLRKAQPFEGEGKHILWAAEVWHSVKRHWVLELQTWIRARRETWT